ncbi:VOC family protein, partial [Nocardioides hankookensis]
MMDEFPGRPIWIELFTHDPDTAIAFYGELLGWTVVDPGPEFGGYQLFQRDGAPVAGLMGNPEDAPGTWTVYLESNNAADTADMARANGGEVVAEPMAVGELGTMAVVTDPGGALVGIWEPGEHPGFAARGEVGAPGWFEVLSDDYDAAVPFYEAVFGWDTHTMSDTADFRYTTLGKDEHAVAGIMAAAGPSH